MAIFVDGAVSAFGPVGVVLLDMAGLTEKAWAPGEFTASKAATAAEANLMLASLAGGASDVFQLLVGVACSCENAGASAATVCLEGDLDEGDDKEV